MHPLIPSLTGTIGKGVWNLPQQFHLYLIGLAPCLSLGGTEKNLTFVFLFFLFLMENNVLDTKNFFISHQNGTFLTHLSVLSLVKFLFLSDMMLIDYDSMLSVSLKFYWFKLSFSDNLQWLPLLKKNQQKFACLPVSNGKFSNWHANACLYAVGA